MALDPATTSVLDTERQTSGRAASAHNCWAISPVPQCYLLNRHNWTSFIIQYADNDGRCLINVKHQSMTPVFIFFHKSLAIWNQESAVSVNNVLKGDCMAHSWVISFVFPEEARNTPLNGNQFCLNCLFSFETGLAIHPTVLESQCFFLSQPLEGWD